jgi:hypothetical protein
MKNIALELPQGLFTAQQTQLLNERLRQVQDLLGVAVELRSDLDAAGKLIKNLGDAKDGADALNQRTADTRFPTGGSGSGGGTTTQTTVASSSTSGGSLLFAVAGPLAIQADAAPLASLATARSCKEIVGLLKVAADDSPVMVDIYVGERKYASLSIPAKALTAKISGSGLGPIPANQPIRIHLVAVGLAPNQPGAGLSIDIRFV